MTWAGASLRVKLFLSHLAVVLVGVGTLFVAAELAAPAFFANHLRRMAGRGHMAGSAAPADGALDAVFRAALLQALLVAAGVAVVVALLASLFVAARIAGPVGRLLRATRRIAAGHYAERVPLHPADASDELVQLAAGFNAMAAELERTEQRRLALIGDVAHELRTPVATLEGYLEGLLDEVVAPSPELFATLHGEAGRLRRLIDDLQELSRAEAGRIPLTMRAVAPATLVQDAVEPLRPQFAEKGLDLTVVVPDDLPPVRADPDRAAQVLTNLLTNALRYTPAPGRVTVELARVAGGVACLVADTGIGFPPGEEERLFERFYRADRSRARASGGAGIGLTIARALAAGMGGTLTAASPGPGRGSTFTFTLPVAR